MKSIYAATLLLPLISGFIIFGITPSLARTTQADEKLTRKWVFDQPASPLRITISSNEESYSLDNYSRQRVTAYRLGCVAEGGGVLRFRRKARIRRVDIPPSDEGQDRRYGKARTIYADPDLYPCIQEKTKLAVLEVRFSNGSRWHAKL